MNDTPTLTPRELASQVATILTNLCAAIARLLIRKPLLILHTAPLWSYINRTSQRFTRLMTRLSEGPLRPPQATARQTQAAPAATARAAPPATTPPRHQLPTGKAWLVKALGWEVVGYMTQLEHLLSRPGVHDIFVAAPQAARLIRPIAHMLATPLPALIAPPKRPPPPPGAPKRKRQPRPHTWPMIYPWDPRYKGPKVTF